MSVPARPLIKFGALAGVLSLPSVARALTGTANGGSASVKVNFSLTVLSQITLKVNDRLSNSLDALSSSATVSVGGVRVAGSTALSDIEHFKYATSPKSAYFVLPLKVGVSFNGPTSVQVEVQGGFTGRTPATPPSGPPAPLARFQCGNGSLTWGTTNSQAPSALYTALAQNTPAPCGPAFTVSGRTESLDLGMWVAAGNAGNLKLDSTITAVPNF